MAIKVVIILKLIILKCKTLTVYSKYKIDERIKLY